VDFFASWDVLGISLVLALRFIGPFALGVSMIAWAAFRPSRTGMRLFSLLGIALGLLTCIAPVVLFLVFDPFS
jgi:hypothetical protein